LQGRLLLTSWLLLAVVGVVGRKIHLGELVVVLAVIELLLEQVVVEQAQKLL
jgi:hypothetical protein